MQTDRHNHAHAAIERIATYCPRLIDPPPIQYVEEEAELDFAVDDDYYEQVQAKNICNRIKETSSRNRTAKKKKKSFVPSEESRDAQRVKDDSFLERFLTKQNEASKAHMKNSDQHKDLKSLVQANLQVNARSIKQNPIEFRKNSSANKVKKRFHTHIHNPIYYVKVQNFDDLLNEQTQPINTLSSENQSLIVVPGEGRELFRKELAEPITEPKPATKLMRSSTAIKTKSSNDQFTSLNANLSNNLFINRQLSMAQNLIISDEKKKSNRIEMNRMASDPKLLMFNKMATHPIKNNFRITSQKKDKHYGSKKLDILTEVHGLMKYRELFLK